MKAPLSGCLPIAATPLAAACNPLPEIECLCRVRGAVKDGWTIALGRTPGAH